MRRTQFGCVSGCCSGLGTFRLAHAGVVVQSPLRVHRIGLWRRKSAEHTTRVWTEVQVFLITGVINARN
jgi:hypothetical protein